MNKLTRFLRARGAKGLAVLLGYPVILLLVMPRRLAVTLWNCRVLLGGKWDRYPGFWPYMAINSLFYRTQAINLSRHGRSGTSPTLALGAYPLSRWFHLCLPASYAFARAGAPVMLFGMAGWWLSHLLWLEQSGGTWVSAVMLLALFSSTFYAMAFYRQNYNALGWALFPVALHAALTGNYLLAGAAWLGASLFSITVVFIGVLASAAIALLQGEALPLLAVLPAAAKFVLNLWPAVRGGDTRTTLATVAKAIGLTSRRVRYRFPPRRLKLGSVYFTAIAVPYVVASFWVGPGAWLVALGMALFLVNQLVARFADDQSLILAGASFALAHAMASDSQWLLLPPLWLLLSPLPAALLLSREPLRDPLGVEAEAPFDLAPLDQAVSRLLAPVAAGERIIAAFEDPGSEYDRVFGGYRVLLELPLYVAARHGIHLMPDWYAVFETNEEGAASFWGRRPEQVLANARFWKAGFALIYQDSGTQLDPAWERAGFTALSCLDWGEHAGDLRHWRLWTREFPPKWWLLRVPPANPVTMTAPAGAPGR